MKIKDAVIERCDKCGHYLKQISPEIYGCDECQKEINRKDDKYGHKTCPYLEITIFYDSSDTGGDGNTSKHEFCSWRCCYNFLSKLKDRTDIDFIALPYLSWDRDICDKYRGDFFDCIK